MSSDLESSSKIGSQVLSLLLRRLCQMVKIPIGMRDPVRDVPSGLYACVNSCSLRMTGTSSQQWSGISRCHDFNFLMLLTLSDSVPGVILAPERWLRAERYPGVLFIVGSWSITVRSERYSGTVVQSTWDVSSSLCVRALLLVRFDPDPVIAPAESSSGLSGSSGSKSRRRAFGSLVSRPSGISFTSEPEST